MIAPVYTSEIAPTSMRGLLSSLPEVFINSGVMLSYVSNLAFSGFAVNLGWRLMFGISWNFIILLVINSLCIKVSRIH
jgi:Sugar (and other) transporter